MHRSASLTILSVLAIAACTHPHASPTPAPIPLTPLDSAHVSAHDAAVKDSLAALGSAHGDSVTSNEVVAQAVEVFGDSATAASAGVVPRAPIAKGPSEVDTTTGPQWDIDVHSYETQERVAHYVQLFSGDAKGTFSGWLQRGTRYDGMIRQKLLAAGIPGDMSFLALIESGYDPNAYSHAAAVGMWQFMSSTARGAGLRVDWWVDERRDPAKSTDAAIRFLRYLKDQFGSMYLVAAAYNGGPGRVERGLNRFADDIGNSTGEDRFFALAGEDYLPRETKEYVPQLIAAALVAKEPDRYGLSIHPDQPYVYDSVLAPPATPLAAIAKATGSTLTDITQLNYHILRGVTPPDTPFWVRIPVGRASAFDSAFKALPAADRTAFTNVRSKKGDTMRSVARAHGLTSDQLAWYNHGLEISRKRGTIAVGQRIRIPSDAVVAAARDVPDPSVERYGSSASRIHIVKRGETLGGIAEKNHTTVKALMRLNGLRKSIIVPGQELLVRGSPRRVHHSAAKKSRKK